jgi:hypothetical protein
MLLVKAEKATSLSVWMTMARFAQAWALSEKSSLNSMQF